jgi:hypothetical protein
MQATPVSTDQMAEELAVIHSERNWQGKAAVYSCIKTLLSSVYLQIKQNYCIFTPTKESVCCWCIGSARRKQCFDRGWGELLLATKKDR